MVTRRIALALLAWLACAHAPVSALTPVLPPPAGSGNPAPPPISSGTAAHPRGGAVATGVVKDLIQRYKQGRQAAITDRVYALSVCGGDNIWGGDSRRSHAYIDRGDTWLARGDAMWWNAQRTADRSQMPRALRDLEAAHHEYRAARYPPPLQFHAKDSPRPHPFPSAYPSDPHPGPGMGQLRVEPSDQWRRHDELPLEEPSRFEEDPHY